MRGHRVTPPKRAHKYHIYHVGKSWLWYCYDCDQHLKGFHQPSGHEAYLSWLWHSKNRCSRP